ncbi:MAPK regulated corepressor interacting protein 2 isoform 2-T2 [Thomomys bottae]
MPAARAAARASARSAPDAAARALAAGECPSHLRRNPERRGAPEPGKASRPAGTASAWRSGRCSPGLRLPPPAVGPRLVFNRVNGRRPLATSPSLEAPQETYTLAHEENVRFVSEDFVPIDLDEWWAQQFLARITNCS